MLVLAAVYNCNIDWLKNMVPGVKLQYLLRRTIKFIRRLQYASSIAKSDIMILEAVERKLFPNSNGDNHGVYETEHHTGESFTS